MKTPLKTSFFACLLSLLPFVKAYSQPAWNTVYTENFNNVSSPDAVPNMYYGCSFAISGSGGNKYLRSTWALEYCYVVFKLNLDAAYEYRMTWSARSNTPGKNVRFFYNTQAGTAGTDISGTVAINFSTSVFTDIGSGTFGVSQSGEYYIGIKPGLGNNSNGSAKVEFDDFRLERRERTVISFAESALTVAEGGSVEVCVNASNPDPDGQAFVEVALATDAAPHLGGFTTQTLSFSGGAQTLQSCFTLQTAQPTGGEDDNYTYTLTLQNPSGGFNAGLGSPSTLTLTVLEANPGCPWAGEDRTICMGDTVQIGCPPVDYPPEYCFRWYGDTGLDNPYLLNPLVFPDETTTYYIYITDDQGDLIGADSVTVTVLENPPILFTPYQPVVCNGASTTVSATDGFASYHWSNGDIGREITVSSPGMYEVTVTAANGCSSLAAVRVEEVNLNYTLLPANPVLCQKTLILSIDSDLPEDRFTWLLPDDVYLLGDSVTLYEPGPVQMIVYGDYGCSDTLSFEVPQAAPEVMAVPDTAYLCSYESSVTFTALPGFVSYEWRYYYSGSLISQGPTLTINKIGDFILRGIDANGCIAEKEVTVDFSPAWRVGPITPVKSYICVQDPGIRSQNEGAPEKTQCSQPTVQLDAGEGFATYAWSNGVQSRFNEISTPGHYTVTVTDFYGCTDAYREAWVFACTVPAFSPIPGLYQICDTINGVRLSPGAGFAAYLWSDDSIQDTLVVHQPGTYSVTVTDESGCSAQKEYLIFEACTGCILDLEMYKPGAIGNNTNSLVSNEDDPGGMIFVNIDDDDMDNKKDDKDNQIPGGDNDLMRLRLKLAPGDSGLNTAKLEVTQGSQYVQIWKSEDKTDGLYEAGTLLTLAQQDGDYLVADLWVEGIQAHTQQKQTVFRLVTGDESLCSLQDEASLTVVGIKNLSWQGRFNGYDGAANASNTLDTADPNFVNWNNADNSPINSFRVFPDKRIIDPNDPTTEKPILTPLRDTVNICIMFSAPPTEPFSLYLRAFDVDDPSEKNSQVDPNDSNTSGNYDGTNGAPGFYAPLTYTAEEDNRGEVMGKKSGHLLGDDDGDGLVQIDIQPDSTMFCNGFKVSLHPGDNYRVAAAFGPEMLMRLGNNDKKHKIHLIDTVNNKQYFESGKMVSGVLTVWRLLNIEFASMKGLSGDDNKVRAWGGKASKAKELVIKEAVYDLHLRDSDPAIVDLQGLEEHFPNSGSNPPSLDLDSGSNGRFENGELSVNSAVFEVIGNGKNYVQMKKKGALVGTHLVFKLTPPGSPVITGTVSEIEKTADSNFVYTLQTSQSLAGVPDSSLFVLTDPDTTIRGDTLGPILAIDTLNKTLTIAKFRKFVKLRDDDRTAVHQLLPYDFAADPLNLKGPINPTYHKVYLESIAVYSEQLFDFKHTIYDNKSVRDWIFTASTYKNADGSSGGDRVGVWQCLVCTVWQSGKFRERDNDPQGTQQDTTNLGLTLSSLSNSIVEPGGDTSVFPLENFMDRVGNLQDLGISIIHELGHQFGLGHTTQVNTLMYPVLSQNTQSMLDIHRNLVRCRKVSPGKQ